MDGTWRDIFHAFYVSEREFIEYMSLFAQTYIQSIRNHFPFDSATPEMRSVLTQLHLVEVLLQAHFRDFAVFFEKPFEEITLDEFCDTLMHFPSNVGAYNSYCRKEDDIKAKITQQRNLSPVLAEVLADCQAQCKGIGLEQLLGVPFLHVVHYPEVVNNIGFCFARGSAEFRLLEGVFVQLSSRIEAVKDAKWAAETAAKTERMLSSIDGLESVGLLLPTRRFLIDGEILSVSRGRARKLSFFVFNDLVLYCKDFSGRLLFSGNV
jgi:hypothetical protein